MEMSERLKKMLNVSPDSKKITMQYGHSENHIIMQFGQPIDNLTMSLAELDAMTKCLKEVRKSFIERGGK